MNWHGHMIKWMQATLSGGWRGAGLVLLVTAAAGATDMSQSPPAVKREIDFTRDVRPILEHACLSCHGPVKPKGKFRLDSQAAALKGGVNGLAIVSGDSARSPLIQYVAGLVPDSEMPPVGKGDPLTDEEVGILRAWIDQDVPWDEAARGEGFEFTLTPTIGATFVRGDERKFREHHGEREGVNGGGEFNWFQSLDADRKLELLGHARQNDYRTVLGLTKAELGFVRVGWEQYRKYYDDSGGYFPSTNVSVAGLGQDLHLDLGKAWIDLGLTLPDWPRMVLGYEYDYRRGDEASTGWGGIGLGPNARNSAPVRKAIDEHVHVIKFDLDAELRGVTIEERFRGEFYELETHYTNSAARGPVSQNVREGTRYFQGANTLRLTKSLKDWWLASAGYLYSDLQADGTFSSTARYASLPALYVATVPQITLERESHVFNLNSRFDPVAGLTLTAGAQSEWTREHGVGGGILHRIPFTFQAPVTLNTNAASLFCNSDENTVSEMFALRYQKLPFTTLFAEARWQQQSIGRADRDLQPSGSYLENIDSTRDSSDLRFGISTSPWRGVTLTTHYRRSADQAEYVNQNAPQPVGSYPGFIRARELLTDEVEARLTLRPVQWLKTSLAYQYQITDSWTDTRAAFNPANSVTNSPGGNVLAGQYESHIYSVGLTLTPFRRWFLDTTFSYQDSVSRTANNNVPSVVPYRGETYSVLASATYVLGADMDVSLGYTFNWADYGQGNFADGLPVGLRYEMHGAQLGVMRRLGKNVTSRLLGACYRYDEPSSRGANDYVAGSIFASLTWRLP